MIVYNKILPFGNYKAINLFGIIFAKKSLTDTDINHEKIHTNQICELLGIGFYIWYLVEYLFKFIYYRNHNKAYYNISFEREAYINQINLNYRKNRKLFSFIKYIRDEKL